MDSNVKVSIIMPVYNVEEYLHDSLNSLINQTLTEIEIICVDDCSTDSSGEILEFFKWKDNRLRILQNTKNVGAGFSRNKALSIAKGEYVLFLDSDDWLDENAIEELYDKATKNNLDVLMFKLINYNQDSGIFFKTDYYSMVIVNSYIDKVFDYRSFDKYKLFKIPNSPCNKLIKTSVLKDNDITFPEGLIHEDNLFFFKLMFNSKRMMITDDYYYNRRIRDNSVMTTQDKKLMDIISITDLVMSYFRQEGYYDEYKRQLLNYLLRALKSRFYDIPIEYKEEYYHKMKENIDKYVNSYSIKEDFEKELYRPNKTFFNLLVNSKDLNEFNGIVIQDKTVKDSYDVSIVFKIDTHDKKSINAFMANLKNQEIDFEDMEIIMLLDGCLFEENTIINQYNDLNHNVKLINRDRLKADYKEEIIRKTNGRKTVFLDDNFSDYDGKKLNVAING